MIHRVQQSIGRGWLVVLLAAAACNHNKESAPPSGMPPLEAAAPGKDSPSLPPGHPGIAPGPGVPGESGAGKFQGQMPGGAFDPKETLRGTIDILPALKDKVSPGETVYLSVRADDGSEKGGTILAVKRLTADKWPISFELDGRDAMFEGTKFEGKVVFWAHIDRDGDPITRGPGDLLGELRLTIPAMVKVRIDKVVP